LNGETEYLMDTYAVPLFFGLLLSTFFLLMARLRVVVYRGKVERGEMQAGDVEQAETAAKVQAVITLVVFLAALICLVFGIGP
jgi:formate hydrogenlyase subunit 3/multisubunit Na+/H+ antiporter MnhD subunit